MKIEGEKIATLLKALNYISLQMMEVIQMGDDGFKDSISDLHAQHTLLIKEFEILSLEVVEKPTNISYLKEAKRLVDKEGDFTSTDNVAIYKSSLYNFIKQQLKSKNIDYSTVKNEELFIFLEGAVILDSQYEKHYYGKEWFYTSMAVMMDIVKEISELREKTPQQKLFN